MHRTAVASIALTLPTLLVLEALTPGDARAAFPGSNGLIAFESNRDGQGEVYVMNPDGSGQTRLTFAGGSAPSWSPDGMRIAFATARDGNSEIYVMNADGSGQTRLTYRVSATDIFPVWSPDGSRIAFASYDCCPIGSNYDIWVMNADGSGQVNITSHPAEDILPTWSPDGSRIAFQSNRDGNTEIYTVHPDGTGLTNVSNSPATYDDYPDWSPDGARIVFARYAGGYNIWVMNAAGGGMLQLTNSNEDSMPAWSPDGTRIAFRSFRTLNDEIFVMNADGTGVTRLTNNAAPGNTLPEDWFPDWQPTYTGTPTSRGSWGQLKIRYR